MMVGLQGSGKTTTCGKLALRLRKKHKKKPLLVAADVQPARRRSNSSRVLGKQLDVPVYFEDGGRPPKICARAVKHAMQHGHDVVILDTAGRLHIDEQLMDELEAVKKGAKPHITYLVADAMTGQDAVNSSAAFHERLDLTGVVLTKLDGDTRGGAALSIRHVTGRPVVMCGVGEKLDALEDFHPERMASRILGMGDIVSLVEEAQDKVDQDEAQRARRAHVHEVVQLRRPARPVRAARADGRHQGPHEKAPSASSRSRWGTRRSIRPRSAVRRR